VSNHIDFVAWAAARPRTTVLSPRGIAPLSTGYASLECGRVGLGGVKKRVEQHVFATFAAVQVNAQVKDTGIRMPLGPPPWRPPE
jgi:hypothetical protein